MDVSDRGIAVNGCAAAQHSAENEGQPGQTDGAMAVWAISGPPGFVWVASSYNPWSFDSRYFGPLPVSIIRRRLKPFLTL